MEKKSKSKKIISVGSQFTDPYPDIVMNAPRLFHLDAAQWAMAVSSAKRWDWSRRLNLYNIYESCMLDTHLTGVIRKRRVGISQFPIEFRKNDIPVDEVNLQIKSPWFRRFLKSLLDVELFGFSAYQFFKDEKGWIDFTQIDHRHIDPHRKIILRDENDMSGLPLSDFTNTLFVGNPADIGELSKVCPWVIWKRNSAQDWAEFCQVFGMPIREFTYDSSDPKARQRIAQQAAMQGSNAVYIHDANDGLKLIEPNRNGSIDLYKSMQDQCNQEISVLILGNTLTTSVGQTGTQALGTVHKSEEDAIKADDRSFVLDVLNYEMTEIFNNLGLNTADGEFVYAEKEEIDTTSQADIVMKMNQLGLPMDDEYLYQTFNIERPDNYEQIKKEEEERKQQMAKLTQQSQTQDRFFANARQMAGNYVQINPNLDW